MSKKFGFQNKIQCIYYLFNESIIKAWTHWAATKIIQWTNEQVVCITTASSFRKHRWIIFFDGDVFILYYSYELSCGEIGCSDKDHYVYLSTVILMEAPVVHVIDMLSKLCLSTHLLKICHLSGLKRDFDTFNNKTSILILDSIISEHPADMFRIDNAVHRLISWNYSFTGFCHLKRLL